MQSGTIFGSQPYDLPLNETTTPQYLKSLGYTTPGVGITEPTSILIEKPLANGTAYQMK